MPTATAPPPIVDQTTSDLLDRLSYWIDHAREHPDAPGAAVVAELDRVFANGGSWDLLPLLTSATIDYCLRNGHLVWREAPDG